MKIRNNCFALNGLRCEIVISTVFLFLFFIQNFAAAQNDNEQMPADHRLDFGLILTIENNSFLLEIKYSLFPVKFNTNKQTAYALTLTHLLYICSEGNQKMMHSARE